MRLSRTYAKSTIMVDTSELCMVESYTAHGTFFYHKHALDATASQQHCIDAHGAGLAVLNTEKKLSDAMDLMPARPTGTQPDLCGRNYYRIGLRERGGELAWLSGERYDLDFVLNVKLRASPGTEVFGEIASEGLDIVFQQPDDKNLSFLCYKPASTRPKPLPETTFSAAISTRATTTSERTTAFLNTTYISLPADTSSNASAVSGAPNAGLVAGLSVLAVALVVALAIFLLFLARKRRKNSQGSRQTQPQALDNPYECMPGPSGAENGNPDVTYSFPASPAAGNAYGDTDASSKVDVCYSTVARGTDVEASKTADVYAQVRKKKVVTDVYSEVKKPKKVDKQQVGNV